MEQAFYQQGLDKLKAGDRANAMQAFDRALRANPQFAPAYQQRAKLRADVGDLSGAIADYGKALSLQPTVETWLGRAIVQLVAGNVQAAVLDAEQAIHLNPEAAAAHNLLGNAQRRLGNTAAAIQAYKQAAKLYVAQKDKANGQRCLDRLSELSAAAAPVSPPDFWEIAQAKMQRQQYRQAIADFNWALQLDPQDTRCLQQRAIARMAIADLPGAMQDLNQALRFSPQELSLWLLRGQVRLKLQDYFGAIEDFTQVLQQQPQQAEALVQRAQAHQCLKQRQAIADYQQALSLQPSDPEIHRICAEAFAEFADPHRAIQHFQTAANLWLNQGNWGRYQQMLDRLKALRSLANGETALSPSVSSYESLQELREQLSRLVGGNWAIAERLLNLAEQKHPGRSPEWYLQKVIADLEQDR